MVFGKTEIMPVIEKKDSDRFGRYLFLFRVFVYGFDLFYVAEHSDCVLYGVDLGGLVRVVHYAYGDLSGLQSKLFCYGQHL